MHEDETNAVERKPDDSVVLVFDSSVFSIEAIKKASYKFAKHCSVSISKSGTEVFVTLSDFTEASAEAKNKLAGALRNEVIDQDLREIIYAKTEAIRNVILAQAFSQTSLLDS